MSEAHGRGIAIQLNYLLDHGGVAVRPNGLAKVKEGVAGLTRAIMTLQAEGDYAKAVDAARSYRVPYSLVDLFATNG